MKKPAKRSAHTEPATIKEIAKKAKVSIGTVDRVVHDRGRVAPATAARVRKIIRETGYKPNIYASHLSRAKTYHFGITVPLPEQDSAFWETSVAGVERAARELHHYRVRVTYFHYDRYAPEQFKPVERKILAAGLDGLLCAPVLHESVRGLLARLDGNIPYVFINTDLDGLTPLSFIGQNSKQSGLVCGRLLRLLVPVPSSVAAILTVPDDPHIRTRADGFKEAFPDGDKVRAWEYQLFAPEKRETTASLLKSIIASHPDLAGVFVANVAVHFVAAELRKIARGRKIFLIGYDLIPANIEALRSGAIDFLISQKPEQQGYKGVYALYRSVALKEKCRRTMAMPIDIITKENVDFYEAH
ncbi:MAG: LacI family DNA-binding transcriptional regulator [Spirochaetales bacterium]|nr:LacI family DNA-binding transcriptional regulator [Spirochaetales bacterium]